jgi:hypothetical protein
VRGDLKWNLKHNLQKWAQPYTTYRRQQDANGERTTTDA